jgi:acetyl-CoA carboxylase carboxyl transferase alpha subunit
VAYLVGHLSREIRRRRRDPAGSPPAAIGALPAWEQVRLARHAARPQTLDYAAAMTTRFVELHGDRQGGDDPAFVGGLAELDGDTVVIVGQQRWRTAEDPASPFQGMAYPEGYRKALRLMHLGAKFQIPVITFIDTRGANQSFESEQRGIAQALARNLAAMSGLPTPIIAVIIGEGGSGGALALGVADRVLMLEHAVYSVISPEGAAAILYRDAAQAESLSEALKLTAHDLLRLGVIDEIVPEPAGGAHLDPNGAAGLVQDRVRSALRELRRVPIPKLLERRYAKYRHIGRVGVYWREVVRKEMQEALDALGRRLPRAEGPWRRISKRGPVG